MLRRLILVAFVVLSPSAAFAVNLNFGQTCTAQQRPIIQAAFTRASLRSYNTYRSLNKEWRHWTQGEQFAFTTWFGAFDNARFQRVGAVLSSIQSQLNNQNVTYDIECLVPHKPVTGNGCQPGDYAEALPNRRINQEILFCDGFFGGQAFGGYDTQWGSVLHEVTHTAANTEDHSYSPREARRHAANNPHKAVDNADNYEYFFELIYLNAGGN